MAAKPSPARQQQHLAVLIASPLQLLKACSKKLLNTASPVLSAFTTPKKTAI